MLEAAQLYIFSIITLFSTRGVLDELFYMLRPAPKSSQFSDMTHIFSWLGMATSLYFVINGMSYLAVSSP